MQPGPDIDIEIRTALVADAGSLARIYNFYIKETTVTFEEEVLPEAEMAARLQESKGHHSPGW